MIPFASFLYFGCLLYLSVFVLVARMARVRTSYIVLCSTALMLGLQYGLGASALSLAPVRDIGRVVTFAVIQLAIATAFLRLRKGGKRRWVFYAAVVAAAMPLVVEKTSSAGVHFIAFIGISYTTFRALDVIFGIQDGLITELPAHELLAFILFFPAISAGPIDRFRRFQPEYRESDSRTNIASDLANAVDRVFRGILYSFVLAPLIQAYWLSRTAHQHALAGIVSYMYAYSLHLFFDFAGYSAFAIAIGYLLGIRMPENFNQPFLARNIVEFWQRWHISLSTWLRDHVYGRFVFAAASGHWFKNRFVAGYLGSALAFGVMGAWHGLAARYLCYGLYHALLTVGYGILTRNRTGKHLPVFVARLVTFHAVCFGFLIFSGRLF